MDEWPTGRPAGRSARPADARDKGPGEPGVGWHYTAPGSMSDQFRTDPAHPAAPAGPGASAGAASDPHSDAASGGPVSILRCAACGKSNRIRPSERGAPHCGACGAALPWIVTATDATFEIEARAAVPVLVDLWAPWCGPCRFVSPIVERLAREFAGRLKVAKVNVDENPATATRFQAFSIPTLVIIRNGRVVDRFVGALPETELKVRLTPFLVRSA